jgi:hypothetical protein
MVPWWALASIVPVKYDATGILCGSTYQCKSSQEMAFTVRCFGLQRAILPLFRLIGLR